jgi:cbb3-type cytochrome oxidase maturation protein
METIYVLLPVALMIAAIAVGLFIWAAKSGQFDDLETPAVRILFDDEPAFASRPLDPAERTASVRQARNAADPGRGSVGQVTANGGQVGVMHASPLQGPDPTRRVSE